MADYDTDAATDAPERDDAQPWLARLAHAEKEFRDYDIAADNIDKVYADLNHLRSAVRDREFALFWSNIQIIGPSIYARAPEPVVTPKFKDRRPLYRTSSEFLERCTKIAFDQGDIDQQMILARDDLAIAGRAVLWVRYEDEDDGDERICFEHKDRKDFLHDPARKWTEVDWAAAAAHMKPKALKDRFGKAGEDAVNGINRKEPIPSTSDVHDDTIKVWEIWCKSENCVVWVTEDCEHVLERSEPYLKLEGFFPCPRPAYATVKRRSLIPVPDMLYYKDQLEEVNTLTRKIHTLAESIKVRGFYQGGGDLGAAVERAILADDDGQVLIPVPGVGDLMMKSGGQPIIWLPLEMIAQTITGLIELRRQVIEDVYQIMGMSDIMRGTTDAGETLGAQRLKQQNSSFRVRDKQNELVRIARDVVRIAAQIMADEFSDDTLEDMAQMDLPTDAEVKKQIKEIQEKARKAVKQIEDAAVEAQDEGQEVDLEQVEQQQQQIIAESQQALEQAGNQVTIDQILEFLGDEKLRPFVLDIETDSTIYPDEAAEKAARAEFMDAFNANFQGMAQAAQMGPEAITMYGGVLKFALAPYRVGRELDGLVDDFVDNAPAIIERMMAQQSEGQDEGLAAAQMKIAEAELGKVEAMGANYQAQAQLKAKELELKTGEAISKAQQNQEDFRLEIEKAREDVNETRAQTEKIMAETRKILSEIGIDAGRLELDESKAVADVAMRQTDRADSVRMQQEQAAMNAQQPPKDIPR